MENYSINTLIYQMIDWKFILHTPRRSVWLRLLLYMGVASMKFKTVLQSALNVLVELRNLRPKMVPLYRHSKTSLALVFISFIMLLFVDHVCLDPEEWYCFDEARNDLLQYNVDVLLQNFALEVYKSSFYSSTSDLGIQTVNGLYLCGGLVTQQVCRDCIGSALEHLARSKLHP